MPERVIGYTEVERDVIISRPCEWTGQGFNGFRELAPIRTKRTLLRPIFEDLGPHTHTTLEDDLAAMPETPLWGLNTDDATGKHKK